MLVRLPQDPLRRVTLSLPVLINFKLPLQPHRSKLSHRMKNLAFHSLLRQKKIILPILTASLINFSLRSLENEPLNLGVKGFEGWGSRRKALTPSLPRVINFKFLLQPHQKDYITQYGELGFSQLTQMKDDYTINSHYFSCTFLLKRLGECTFWPYGSESLNCPCGEAVG